MLPEIDGKKKCIEVPKQYVFATETTDWIIKGEKYEVAEMEPTGAYIIDESGEQNYYDYNSYEIKTESL